MAFVPFTNIVKAELFYRQDDQHLENVLHWRFPAAPNETTLEQLAADLASWWDTGLKSIVTSKVSLVGIKCTSLNSASAPAIEYSTGMPIVGTGSAGALPNNVTVVVKFTTAKRGRSYRGRLYHVGLFTTQVTDNVITTAAQTALTSVYSALTIPAGFNDAVFVVASRIQNGVELTLGVDTRITGASINRTLDSQRRRLPERGL